MQLHLFIVCTCMYVYATKHMCGDQRTAFRSGFFPSTMWVEYQTQVIRLDSKHHYLPLHLTGPHNIILIIPAVHTTYHW